jgi:hypothetical protein
MSALSRCHMHGPAALTGRAVKGVTRLLREHGFNMGG